MPHEPAKQWSRGNLDPTESCPACNSEAVPNLHFTRQDDGKLMPDKWHVTQCPDCKSLWLNPRPDASSLHQAYENYYTHNAAPQNTANKTIENLTNGFINKRFKTNRKNGIPIGYYIFKAIEPFRLKLEYYGRNLPNKKTPHPKLLDIGCGNGNFLLRAKEMGWDSHGCEVDPKAINACLSLGLNVFKGNAFNSEIPSNNFDAITISHVLEHIIEQQELIQHSYELLKPGGCVWLALPNPESLGLRIFGAAWQGIHPPYHLCIPSQKIIKKWLKDSGFIRIKSLRRGSHAAPVWKTAKKIAENESIKTPKMLSIWKIISNTLSTLTPKYSEETVIIAYKPDIKNEK